MATRCSCVKAMLRSWALPGVDRLWWWLALVSLLALLGQEIARTSAIGLATAAFSDFEGFGDEGEELEEEPVIVVAPPPPASRRPGFETDHGPPLSKVDSSESLRLAPPMKDTAAPPPTHVKAHHRHEYWDEDEFEGSPEEDFSSRTPDGTTETSPDPDSPKTSSTPAARRSGPQHYYIEIVCISFLIAFAIAYFLGKKKNEKIALAWATQFACKDGIFDRNFSLLGTSMEADSPLLIKEGQTVFKFYASGRRYCHGLLATMDLLCRQDLISCMWYHVSPRKDEMTIEVFMNEENMEPLTFALVHKKKAKAMLKDLKDLQTYGASQYRRPGLSEELAVLSEFRDLAFDLLTDTVLDQVFGDKAFEKFGTHFVSLHFTDDFSSLGSQKKILQFKFTLPSVNSMGDMSRLIALIPYYIDLLGRYKLNAQLRTKAEAARSKVAKEAFKETQIARQEALQRKKQERRKALKSVESNLSVGAVQKREEKERLRQVKKSMPRIRISKA